MKKFYRACFAFLLCFSLFHLHAQKLTGRIPFAGGELVTDNNIATNRFAIDSIKPAFFGDKYFVALQFTVLPSLPMQEQLKAAGIILGKYLSGNAYLATLPADFTAATAQKFGIAGIAAMPPALKVDAPLNFYHEIKTKETGALMAVHYFTAVDRALVEEALRALGAAIVPTKLTGVNAVFVQPSKRLVAPIAALPYVYFISLQNTKDKLLNNNSIAMHGMSVLQSPAGRNLNGKGIVVGIGDNTEIVSEENVIDFRARVINRVPYPYSLHGIHVSGTVAGAGIYNPKYHGMAPRATIVSQWLSDVVYNTPTYVADYNMIATNNSYTAADDGCTGNGVYDILSNYADAQVNSYPTVLHVFAAGNDGTYTCGPYQPGFATVKTGWQTAKNVLTVGAIKDTTYTAAPFSSRGPVNDGRIKPEIVTKGVMQWSTGYFLLYFPSDGTSMAAPVVTGGATLMNERYRQLFGSTPKAALIKALMCNTAEDLGNAGPDYTYGFGMLNARKAVEAMEGNQFYFNNTTSANTITVPAGVRRLKVMLYWPDAAGTVGAPAALVNDWDLSVTGPSGTHLPLVLNPAPGSENLPATEGADHTNNIEQVTIDLPAAGIYTIHVNPFAIPAGPQEYVVTYALDSNGIRLDYPYGGEKWVPGESESIRWTAYGDETNTFTIEYSDNNGGAWNLIDNNVPASARSYIWTNAIATTNDALIRVRRNASAYSAQSTSTFTVLGQPVITATVPCEGFVQLNWAAVPGATSYDVLQLQADTMGVIATTTSLNYLVQGLNNTSSYWFGVAAKNGSASGRRSISARVTAASGTCTLADFDNNFKAVSIDAPVSGRQLTSTALGATAQVKLTIKNLDDGASAGSYDLYYQVNGGAIVTEADAAVVASLVTYTHVFAPTTAFATTGVYNIKAWVKRSGDNQPLDDTTTITIKNIANDPVTLPLADGFEGTSEAEYIANTLGLDGDDRVDFAVNNTRGRARTFVNSGFALHGNRAVTLDQKTVFSTVFPINTDSLLVTYNAATYNGDQLRFDFNYKNHGQPNVPDNKVWIRGSDTQPWVLAYDLAANQAALGQWKHGVININDVLDTVLPAQPITTSFQVKIGQQGYTSANDPYPQLDQDDGYTFDDIALARASNDIAITKVLSPSQSGCGAAGSGISIEIKNYSGTTFTGVPVTYNVNGSGPVTEFTTVVPGIQVYNFTTPYSFVNNIDYSIDLYIHSPADDYPGNDSILNYTFHSSPLIAVTPASPYLEGFESSNGNWYARGANSSWVWGTPTDMVFKKAANGTKIWATGLSGNYNNNELSYLYSPCFDLTGLAQPVFSFSHILQIEDDCFCDYDWVEYSADGGLTWLVLGTNGAGVNWYNDQQGFNRWGVSIDKWHVASFDVPVKTGNVRFRFVMSSDLGVNYKGVGIDDVHIFDKAAIYTGTPVTGITLPVSGSNWIHFNDVSGKRVASINPLGKNLGNTVVDVYPYTGSVRTSNNQYYVNRNIVVTPEFQPTGAAMVRLYFTDAEAKALIAATGCTPCSKPGDPYELGVTEFTGLAAELNGTLGDDADGLFQYILPANTDIIPYDNGYYAEFAITTYGELWLNNGGITGTQPLPLTLLSFDAIKQNKTVLLQWHTANELNVDHYSIEKSRDGIAFSAIGSSPANALSATNTYTFTDAAPYTGINYYRLKIFAANGNFTYSPVRRINFNGAADNIAIYPNPVSNGLLYITTGTTASKAELFDATGRLANSFLLNGRYNTLNTGALAKGLYMIKVYTESAVYTQKLILQ